MVATISLFTLKWIIFEITEGSTMSDPEQATANLQRLDPMSYQLAN